MYVVLTGNLLDGFNIHGPLKTIDEAHEWAQAECKDEPYCIAPLKPVEPPAYYMVSVHEDSPSDPPYDFLGMFDSIMQAESAIANFKGKPIGEQFHKIHKCERVK